MTGDAVKAKNGAMVAYDGQMSFKKMTGGGEGLRGMVTRGLTGEQAFAMELLAGVVGVLVSLIGGVIYMRRGFAPYRVDRDLTDGRLADANNRH